MSRASEHAAPGNVWAYLGPTNTGKTHRAIERMLELPSGMMGLPLRLLAREVYERVSTRVGEQAVALVTGEEKRVPPRARYWICTVEAMPSERLVDFVAIDEIQLMGHPERGHVFTDRLLHWRGRVETWFLGSQTAERLVRSLVPGVQVRHLPRLSELRYTGQNSLRTLPRRSATVAFSMPQVYELADALRARRGGAAVVLGALSPRVRNAQVALYQAGEVDFLVATDAIGMGLNLDIEHVAMAGRVKFDGFEVRELENQELAQIVGRAGRHLRDGTFGTLAPEPELSKNLVEQLEQHRFASLKRAYYRNAALAYDSVDQLIASLAARPPAEGLVLPPEGDDLQVLKVLANKPEILARAESPEGVSALWAVCRIPNYEKRIPEHQAARLVPLFDMLVAQGRLDDAYVDRELSRLALFEGDIHQLMERLSGVRTWTYVSHQPGWLRDAETLQARAHALEDKLGDLLHQRLLERFVVTGARVRVGRSTPVRGEGSFARLLTEKGFVSEAESERLAQERWVEELVAAPFAELQLTSKGDLFFQDEQVGKLAPGSSLQHPQVRAVLPEWLSPSARSRSERRLTAHARDLASHLVEPLRFESASAKVRGLLYQLEQTLGTLPRPRAEAELHALSEAERHELAAHGIVMGQRSVYARDMLSPERRTLRLVACRLLAADLRAFQAVARDADQALFLASTRGIVPETLAALGFVAAGPHALRCDVLERVLDLKAREGAEAMAVELSTLVSDETLAASLVSALTRKRKRRRR